MRHGTSLNELKPLVSLPTPMGTALDIVRLLRHESSALHDVVKLITADAELSHWLLFYVNSETFATDRQITTIQEAVTLLGVPATRDVAIAYSLLNNYKQGACKHFDYAIFWSHALARAVALAKLTHWEATLQPEEAFTLGVLSEIGRLAMVTAWPEVYDDCVQRATGHDLLDLEFSRFNINHQQLCLLLLADWGISRPILEALKLSYAVEINEVSRTGRLARQLVFARQLAGYCLTNIEQRSALLESLAKEACHHTMDSMALNDLITNLITDWQRWGKAIDISTDVYQSDARIEISSSTNSAQMDILLVDDDPIMIARLSKQLTTAGYKVAVCRDGESALHFALEHKPPLLITDWHMQSMDGIELSKAIRNSSIGKSIYILMLTAAESEDDLVRAFDAGIDDYVTKPISTKVFFARLRAGKRIAMLQQEVERERRDVQRYTAELVVSNRRLELMANTDMLTDLPNRRYALNRLSQEIETGQRRHRPVSVLMMDLDHFKTINDTYGHDAGDKVLIHIAKLIKDSVRGHDIAARLGGEEFMIIAPDTQSDVGLLLAERIRYTVEHNQPDGLNLQTPVTISIGVAGCSEGEPCCSQLMKLADRALYHVKQTGRNGVSLADNTLQ